MYARSLEMQVSHEDTENVRCMRFHHPPESVCIAQLDAIQPGHTPTSNGG